MDAAFTGASFGIGSALRVGFWSRYPRWWGASEATKRLANRAAGGFVHRSVTGGLRSLHGSIYSGGDRA